MKKSFKLVIIILFLVSACSIEMVGISSFGRVFYIDCVRGNDDNVGTSRMGWWSLRWRKGGDIMGGCSQALLRQAYLVNREAYLVT